MVECGSSCLLNLDCSAFHFVKESKTCDHGYKYDLIVLPDSTAQQAINVHIDSNYVVPNYGKIIKGTNKIIYFDFN